MNLADLYRMLDAGLLDYVLGVLDAHNRDGAQHRCTNTVLFIPPRAMPSYNRKQTSVRFDDIAKNTFVMGCASKSRRKWRSSPGFEGSI